MPDLLDRTDCCQCPRAQPCCSRSPGSIARCNSSGAVLEARRGSVRGGLKQSSLSLRPWRCDLKHSSTARLNCHHKPRVITDSELSRRVDVFAVMKLADQGLRHESIVISIAIACAPIPAVRCRVWMQL